MCDFLRYNICSYLNNKVIRSTSRSLINKSGIVKERGVGNPDGIFIKNNLLKCCDFKASYFLNEPFEMKNSLTSLS